MLPRLMTIMWTYLDLFCVSGPEHIATTSKRVWDEWHVMQYVLSLVIVCVSGGGVLGAFSWAMDSVFTC